MTTDAQRILRELIKRLVATGKLELATPRDEDTLPAALEAALELEDDDDVGDTNEIGETLADLGGVVELYATDEEIAAIVAELRSP